MTSLLDGFFLFFAPALPESAFWTAASTDGSERRMGFSLLMFCCPHGPFYGRRIDLDTSRPGIPSHWKEGGDVDSHGFTLPWMVPLFAVRTLCRDCLFLDGFFCFFAT